MRVKTKECGSSIFLNPPVGTQHPIISEEKALDMGIKGFLMKPVTISSLDKKILDVLDKKESET